MAYLDSLCRWGLSTLLPSSPLHPIHRDFIKKNENISEFFAKRGGGGVSPIPKFPYQKKLGLPNC